MLDILANSQRFAREPELLLDGFEGCDKSGWIVGAEEVPGVEAGEVLESAEQLVTADCEGVRLALSRAICKPRRAIEGCDWVEGTCSRNEAEVVGYRWVVDDCVRDHLDSGLSLWKGMKVSGSRNVIDER